MIRYIIIQFLPKQSICIIVPGIDIKVYYKRNIKVFPFFVINVLNSNHDFYFLDNNFI